MYAILCYRNGPDYRCERPVGRTENQRLGLRLLLYSRGWSREEGAIKEHGKEQPVQWLESHKHVPGDNLSEGSVSKKRE